MQQLAMRVLSEHASSNRCANHCCSKRTLNTVYSDSVALFRIHTSDHFKLRPPSLITSLTSLSHTSVVAYCSGRSLFFVQSVTQLCHGAYRFQTQLGRLPAVQALTSVFGREQTKCAKTQRL
eukprot:3776252-Amphidinium_carterae.1